MRRQLRVSDGHIIGFDLAAMVSVARDTGISPSVAADLLAVIESAAVPAMNAMKGDQGG